METCSSLVKTDSDWENNFVCKIHAISGSGIETFYLVTKYNNFWSSTIHLVDVDMIGICKFNINYRNVFLYKKA